MQTSESASLGPRKPYLGVPFCSAGCAAPSSQEPPPAGASRVPTSPPAGLETWVPDLPRSARLPHSLSSGQDRLTLGLHLRSIQ